MIINIVALIPARSGSKGLINKNIKLLGGKSLLNWSISACKRSKLINRIIVSTDSEEYANLSVQYGAEAPFLRPPSISADNSTDYEFVIHALDWLKQNGDEPEYIAHIRPTTPFRSPEIIDKAILTFAQSSSSTSLRSVHEMSESAYKTFEISKEGNLMQIFSGNSNLDESNNARQKFPKTYIANGYVDILSTKFIRKKKLLHGDRVISFVTENTTEVDNQDDFDFLEYKLVKSPHFFENIFI